MAAAAAADGGSDWPDLLPSLAALAADAAHPAAAAGAVRALASVAEDADADAAAAAAPVLLPALFRIVSRAATAGADAATRRRAVGVGRALLDALAVAGGGAGGTVDAALAPWFTTLASALSEPIPSDTPDAAANAWGLKLEALRFVSRALAAFGRAAAPAAPPVLAAAWALLSATAPVHAKATAAASSDPGYDSDGREVSPAATLAAALDLMAQAASDRRTARALADGGAIDLLRSATTAAVLPGDVVTTCVDDLDAWVEEEEDGSVAGPRAAAEALAYELTAGDAARGAGPLASAVARSLADADAARDAGDPDWWRLREAGLALLAAAADGVAGGGGPAACAAVGLPLDALTDSLLTRDTAHGAPPFLTGTVLTLLARLPPTCLGEARVAAALAAAAASLGRSAPATLGGLRVVTAHAAASPPPALEAALPALTAGLDVLLSSGGEGGLAAALEAAAALTRGARGACAPWASSAARACLAIWGDRVADPLLAPAAADVVLELARAGGATAEAAYGAALPALATVLRDPRAAGATAVAAALDLAASLLAHAPPAAAGAAHAALTPPALALLGGGGGGGAAVAAAACDYVRALARAGGPALLASDGALDALTAPLLALLTPGSDDAAAERVAPALSSILRRAPPASAPALARACLLAAAHRIATPTSPALAADLVGLLARGVLADEAGAVEALATRPAPANSPPPAPSAPPPATLLHAAIAAWTIAQADVCCAHEITVATAGLGALLTAGSAAAATLATVPVRGARLDDGPGIRTRARARAAAESWSVVGALCKIVELMADAVVESAEGNGDTAAADDGWATASDDDDASDGGASAAGSLAAALAAGAEDMAAARAWADDDDDDAAADAADADADGDPLASTSPGAVAADALRAAAAADGPGLAAVVGGLAPGRQRAVERVLRGPPQQA